MPDKSTYFRLIRRGTFGEIPILMPVEIAVDESSWQYYVGGSDGTNRRFMLYSEMPLGIADGGTASNTATGARAALGLGSSSVLTAGSGAGDVPVLGSGGLLDVSYMGSGSASNSTVLHGDNTWSAVVTSVNGSAGVITSVSFLNATTAFSATQTMPLLVITGASAGLQLCDRSDATKNFQLYDLGGTFAFYSSVLAANVFTIAASSGNMGVGNNPQAQKLYVQAAASQDVLKCANSSGSALFFVDQVGNCTIKGHIIGGSASPSISAGMGAGTAPTVSIDGTDISGTITLTTGTLPIAAGTVVTVTFAVAYASAPKVALTGKNATTALLSGATMVFPTTTTATLVVTAGPTGLAAATQYIWDYQLSQ